MTRSVDAEPTTGEPRLRKDAQRSRRLVLEAAKDLFAARGVDVGFDEIARSAGVGVGTVYRRFPCREALVEELFAEKLERVKRLAAAALDIDDPWEALVWFCEHCIGEQQCDRGLTQVLAVTDVDADRLGGLREEIGAAVDDVVRRAQEAGLVRADLAYADLAITLHVLSRMRVEGSEVWRRYLALFLSSIRAQPGQDPLPGPSPTFATVEEIARRL
ncbi:TetR/AcrR family transcriptional regulator [Nocardioides sp.]|uniref:TetR/AcrR family transcriptional regulator n=1 Tax=Nocardioides sp. TaxID=35761 RepID=UPI0025ECFDA1|nr:TetR/AcrR family transcriptional regulator [Nocardioides sp.]